MDKKEVNKNYSEAEYKKLVSQLWKIFSMFQDKSYEMFTKEEIFLNGFLWGKNSLSFSSRIFSLMNQNAKDGQRSSLGNNEIIRKQIPLLQLRFNTKLLDQLENDKNFPNFGRDDKFRLNSGSRSRSSRNEYSSRTKHISVDKR